jgi:hypothetical protein
MDTRNWTAMVTITICTTLGPCIPATVCRAIDHNTSTHAITYTEQPPQQQHTHSCHYSYDHNLSTPATAWIPPPAWSYEHLLRASLHIDRALCVLWFRPFAQQPPQHRTGPDVRLQATSVGVPAGTQIPRATTLIPRKG